MYGLTADHRKNLLTFQNFFNSLCLVLVFLLSQGVVGRGAAFGDADVFMGTNSFARLLL